MSHYLSYVRGTSFGALFIPRALVWPLDPVSHSFHPISTKLYIYISGKIRAITLSGYLPNLKSMYCEEMLPHAATLQVSRKQCCFHLAKGQSERQLSRSPHGPLVYGITFCSQFCRGCLNKTT